MTRRDRCRAFAALALVPACARAHSPIPGIGAFYNGALHPFVVPAHFMALLGLGLWIGRRGIAVEAEAAITLLAGLAAGAALGGVVGWPGTDMAVLAGSAVVALIVALARPLPNWALVVVAAAIGLGVGLGSDPEGLSGSARWTTLAGTCLGAFIGSLWIAAITEFAKPPWLKIAVRVVASWVAASALLVLALSWVGPRRVAAASHAGAASAVAPASNPR